MGWEGLLYLSRWGTNKPHHTIYLHFPGFDPEQEEEIKAIGNIKICIFVTSIETINVDVLILVIVYWLWVMYDFNIGDAK